MRRADGEHQKDEQEKDGDGEGDGEQGARHSPQTGVRG